MIPAFLIAGIAARLLSHEQERLDGAAETAAYGQLLAVSQQVELAVEVVQDELLRSLQALPSKNLGHALQRWEQDNPLVRNVFIWQGANDLLLPDTTLPLTREQREFLQRYNTLFNGSRSWEEAHGQKDTAPSTSQKLYVRMKGRQPQRHGTWIPWYWENRFGMIGWTQKEADGPRYGVELEMVAMLSEMVSVLPPMPDNRLMVLVDGAGHRIYQSGGLEIPDGLNPALRIPVGRVLPHWEMVLYTPDGTFAGDALGYALLSGLLVGFLFLALFVSSGLLLRDAHRNRLDARQKTTFVSNVSHELKTPLTTIRMYADLLGDGRVADPEKAKRYLRTIVGESERLTRLVNNVLDFSRLEQNRKKYRITSFDLSEALEETLQSQRIRIQNATMELMVSLPPTPSPISTDRDALQQVWLNLIDNAIKYAADGGTLSIELTPAPNGYFIAITDAGPGIPKKYRRRIFERFYRIDDSITAATQGCGLGLGIARHLLADLSADLEYQPAQGGGANFIITLPTSIESP